MTINWQPLSGTSGSKLCLYCGFRTPNHFWTNLTIAAPYSQPMYFCNEQCVQKMAELMNSIVKAEE
jgi:hypothetical protein